MSGVFDLDESGAAALDERARMNPLDPKTVIPAWAGSGEAAKGLMSASAAAGRALTMAGAVQPIGWDFAVSTITGKQSTRLQEAYFRDVVDEIGNSAVDYWKPDAAQMGSAAKVLNVGASVAGSLPQLIGAPALFLGGQALDPATEVVRQGGGTGTALGVGGVNLAANAVGMRLPASFGTGLVTQMATGAASNVAVGAVADAGTAAILNAGGMGQMAQTFDWSDPFARGLDLVMGAAFGYKGSLDAARVPAAQRDAVLAANNNDHATRRSMPGEPLDPAAERQHIADLNTALEQLAAGQPVDVTSQPGNFALRPEAGGAPDLAGYEAMLVALESGGRADARAPTSSATGLHQFTDSTWLATVQKAAPAWAEGLGRAELLAMRTDPAKSAQMERALRAENAAALEANGVPADPFNLYAAHHFGAKAGVKFAKAADDVPMEQLLSAQQIEANPYLRGKTKGQALAEWHGRAQRAGVEVPRAGAAEDAVPDLLADLPPPRTAADSGQVIDDRIALLENLSSTDRMSRQAIEALRTEDQQLVSQMRTQERRQAAGVIPADPRAGLSEADLSTITARRAEIRQTIERHNAAMGYENQLSDLRRRLDNIDSDRALMALAERLRPSPAQRRTAARVAEPAQPGRPEAVVGTDAPPVPAARAVAPEQSGGDVPARSTEAPRPPTTEESSAVARDSSALAQQQGPLADLQRLQDTTPTAMLVDGFDADAAPRYVSVADAVAEITAARAQAEREASAYSAAVSCFLRLGT